MTSIRHELFAQAARACECLGPQALARAVLVDPEPSPARDAEFGLLALADGSAGLYYAWLGGEQAALPQRFRATDIEGVDVLEVCRLYLGDSDVERSIGLAAISAVTASLYQRAGYVPPSADDSFAGLTLVAGDRLGMIGNFPPLVRRARALGVDVAVVERKAHMVTREPGLVISLDPAVLHDLDQVICTGATLLNDSFEAMLAHCRHARRIALVGPSVGFFPDAVFARGIDVVAGTRVLDVEQARTRLAAGERMGASATRTLIQRADYPGFATLLARAMATAGLADAAGG
ncbi:MAG: DUF364 domain-containing protein [Gammaproteobacteria bacterium]